VCVPVVIKRYPEVGKALKLLGAFIEARMSGTGASVFAQFASKQEAEQTLAQLESTADWSHDWRAYICQGRNQSPLIEFMKTI
jgi:4-diphosphocytidyl-2-C-methyl-D-erythritol kinase